MLLLCSNGLTSPKLVETVKKHLTKSSRAALVVTADNVYKEKNYHVGRCVQTLGSMGLQVDLFDLDHRSVEELLTFDVVEFIGGNPFYLLNAIRKSQAIPALRILSEQRVLIGWSAAAFVFGPTLELVNRYSPEMNFLELQDLSGIGLTDIPVLPHYSRFLEKFSGFETICTAFEEEAATSVIRLNDGDGICIQNGMLEIIRA